MRTKKSFWIIIAAFALCATPIQAQGFGSILKKAKKVLTPSNEPAKTETPQAKPAASNASEEPIATGGTLINPLKDKVDVQLVGAYGKSTSENYGEVSLVLKVKMIANKNEISIGGNSNWPVMLIDEEGNVSEPRYLGWTPYSVSEGIYMKIILKDSSTFTNVKKSAKIIQKAQIALSLSYDEKGLLIMKNVPIQWDVQPEESTSLHITGLFIPIKVSVYDIQKGYIVA